LSGGPAIRSRTLYYPRSEAKDSKKPKSCFLSFYGAKEAFRPSAEALIRLLHLRPHPREGGWYCETYRSALQLPANALAPRYPAARSAGTAIYYLLTPDTISALHRLTTDEVFHFYLGDPVEMLQLGPSPENGGRILTLGSDILAGQQVQTVVPAGVWQGSVLRAGGSFALMGATVAPGFDFADYEAAERDALIATFPDFAERITRLCPQ
jgi:predicted cupin superfamily sugar epimerase